MKRYKDNDIAPSGTTKNVFISQKDKEIIEKAKSICNERVKLSKEKKVVSIYNFVEQKKEMFLVQLTHNTIKDKIGSLETKLDRKHRAWKQSEHLLHEDEKIARSYVENSNAETKNMENYAEDTFFLRKQKDDELKEIDDKILHYKLELSKHKDTVDNLERHKAFIVELSDGEFCAKQEANKKLREQKLLEKFIEDNLPPNSRSDK